MNNHEVQTCENCGTEINCFGGLSCECAGLEIPEAVSDYIGATFDRCLCRTCIMSLAEEMRN
ncbi:MAG: cysteine-rich CWC family protein [Mangrovibacterium sp.]